MRLLSVAAPSLGFWVPERLGFRFGITSSTSFGVGGEYFLSFFSPFVCRNCGIVKIVRNGLDSGRTEVGEWDFEGNIMVMSNYSRKWRRWLRCYSWQWWWWYCLLWIYNAFLNSLLPWSGNNILPTCDLETQFKVRMKFQFHLFRLLLGNWCIRRTVEFLKIRFRFLLIFLM